MDSQMNENLGSRNNELGSTENFENKKEKSINDKIKLDDKNFMKINSEEQNKNEII